MVLILDWLIIVPILLMNTQSKTFHLMHNQEFPYNLTQLLKKCKGKIITYNQWQSGRYMPGKKGVYVVSCWPLQWKNKLIKYLLVFFLSLSPSLMGLLFLL